MTADHPPAVPPRAPVTRGRCWCGHWDTKKVASPSRSECAASDKRDAVVEAVQPNVRGKLAEHRRIWLERIDAAGRTDLRCGDQREIAVVRSDIDERIARLQRADQEVRRNRFVPRSVEVQVVGRELSDVDGEGTAGNRHPPIRPAGTAQTLRKPERDAAIETADPGSARQARPDADKRRLDERHVHERHRAALCGRPVQRARRRGDHRLIRLSMMAVSISAAMWSHVRARSVAPTGATAAASAAR